MIANKDAFANEYQYLVDQINKLKHENKKREYA